MPPQQLDEIGAAIKEQITTDPALAAHMAILVSIPIIAVFTAAMVGIEMPKLRSLDLGAAAVFAGLAPITRQSGQRKGKALVQGERKLVRQAVYMPSRVAMQFDPDMKAQFDQIIAAGKAPKQAITAMTRYLIVLAKALLQKASALQQRPA